MKKLSLLLTALAVFATSQVSARDAVLVASLKAPSKKSLTTTSKKDLVLDFGSTTKSSKLKKIAADKPKDNTKGARAFVAKATDFMNNILGAGNPYLQTFNREVRAAGINIQQHGGDADALYQELTENYVKFVQAGIENPSIQIIHDKKAPTVVALQDALLPVATAAADAAKHLKAAKKANGNTKLKADAREALVREKAEEILSQAKGVENIFNPGDVIDFVLAKKRVKTHYNLKA